MPKRPPTFTYKTGTAKKVTFKLGYDSAYRKVREQVVREEPLCRTCLSNGHVTPGEQVDHIKPLANGGTHDRHNLQHLCIPCHKAKTRSEISKGGRDW